MEKYSFFGIILNNAHAHHFCTEFCFLVKFV
jgi:hypothetical protein